jgi:hypothetical protein
MLDADERSASFLDGTNTTRSAKLSSGVAKITESTLIVATHFTLVELLAFSTKGSAIFRAQLRSDPTISAIALTDGAAASSRNSAIGKISAAERTRRKGNVYSLS